MRRDGQLLRQVSMTEDLDVDARALDQARLLERVRRDLAFEALEVADVERLHLGSVRTDRHRVLGRRTALLAEAHVDRHLTALEARAHLVRARARLLALDPAAGVAALAGAHAAADALAALARGGRLERCEVQLLRHCLFLDHLDEMADLSELTGELRALRVLSGAADLAQPEGP
jgi:hypothetical protein